MYRSWPILLTIAGTAFGTYTWLKDQFNSQVVEQCQPEIDLALKAERLKTNQRFKDQYAAHQRLELRELATEENLQRIYWLYVGETAAAHERLKSRKELAAANARLRFLERIKRGDSYRDAADRVLGLGRPP